MILKNKILVTTTEILDGWDVVSYICPISSHVVAGTNFFSDMFAGLSDIFGGRSGAYQKQLSSIHEEAISLLKKKANMLGANCVLGLSIDHDEISGKGKSMFMVTAIGTAVKIQKHDNEIYKNIQSNHFLESDEFQILKRKNYLVDLAKKGKLTFEDEIWDFIIKYKVIDVSEFLTRNLSTINISQPLLSLDSKFVDKSREFFNNLDDVDQKRIVYNSIMNDNNNVFLFMKDIVKANHLVDFDEISQLLDSDNDQICKRAFILLQFEKKMYLSSDIVKIEDIYNNIRSRFHVERKIIKEKAKLSSNIKEKWLCVCGKKNDIDDLYCSGCKKDPYGFTCDEVNPEAVMSILKEKVNILKEVFNPAN